MPYTGEEMQAILAACSNYTDTYGRVGWQAKRVKAFALLMRYSGLRIRDTAQLAIERIDGGGKLFLYTQKSGTPVYLPLPRAVLQALKQFPHANERYYFWSGTSTPAAVAGSWNKILGRVFTAASIRGGHSHRFRDTFAVELLKQGVPLERVSILLGHSPLRITEKHYAPWVRERQEQLEQDILRTWAHDPILATQESLETVQ